MNTITKEEMDEFLVSIGGLESGIRTDIGPLTDAYIFSVGPGWYGLIKSLIEELINAGWDKQVCQIKEKFGGLRFYVNSAPKEVHDIIYKYESISMKTCEVCGNLGEIQGNPRWLTCLCEEHKYKPKEVSDSKSL